MKDLAKQLFKGATAGILAFFCFSLILFVCIISSCFLSFWIPAKINDSKMDRFEKSVSRLSILNDSRLQIIAIDKRFGLLVGNGNHCDGNVAVLFQSDLDYIEVYETIDMFDFDQEVNWPYSSLEINQRYNPEFFRKEDFIQLYYLQDNKIMVIDGNLQLVELSSSYDTPKYEFLQELSNKVDKNDNMNYFILSIMDFEGYSLTFDMRCR